MSMTSDCFEEVVDWLLGRACPYNGEFGVHRGSLPLMYTEFTITATQPYTMETFNRSFSYGQEHMVDYGLFINYCGPGNRKVVVPRLDRHGSPDICPQTFHTIDGPWEYDGVMVALKEDRQGNQLYVAGQDIIVFLVDGGERWVIPQDNTMTDVMLLRTIEGILGWEGFMDTLSAREEEQFEVGSLAVPASLARILRRHAGAIGAKRISGQQVTSVLGNEMRRVRSRISWLSGVPTP
jgi:hypothetical protein